MLLYAMQAGEYENFDKIKQVNELKEKHKRPDNNKPADVQCTKNLLRNLNQTMLRFLQRSAIAKTMMKDYFKDYQNRDDEIEKFKKWAISQKMDNFLQCRTLWTFNSSHPQFNYLFLFREIQFEFFANSSCPAIFSSKVRNEESKKTHLKYIHAFLRGIRYPHLFTCFKKSGKLKEQEKNMEEEEEGGIKEYNQQQDNLSYDENYSSQDSSKEKLEEDIEEFEVDKGNAKTLEAQDIIFQKQNASSQHKQTKETQGKDNQEITKTFEFLKSQSKHIEAQS